MPILSTAAAIAGIVAAAATTYSAATAGQRQKKAQTLQEVLEGQEGVSGQAYQPTTPTAQQRAALVSALPRLRESMYGSMAAPMTMTPGTGLRSAPAAPPMTMTPGTGFTSAPSAPPMTAAPGSGGRIANPNMAMYNSMAPPMTVAPSDRPPPRPAPGTESPKGGSSGFNDTMQAAQLGIMLGSTMGQFMQRQSPQLQPLQGGNAPYTPSAGMAQQQMQQQQLRLQQAQQQQLQRQQLQQQMRLRGALYG